MRIQEKSPYALQPAGTGSGLPPAARAVPATRQAPHAQAARALDSSDAQARALQGYPDTVQLAEPFLLFEQHALAIQKKAGGGAPLSHEDGEFLRPRHEYGPCQGPRRHMMTCNYHEHDPNLRTIGTAEAVVSKDLNGAVTVSVLAEKGTLDRGSPSGERGSPIAYRYKTTDSDSATYLAPG